MSFPVGLSRGAAGGDRVVASGVTTGTEETAWIADAACRVGAAGLAETMGMGMTVMGTDAGSEGGRAGTEVWCWR